MNDQGSSHLTNLNNNWRTQAVMLANKACLTSVSRRTNPKLKNTAALHTYQSFQIPGFDLMKLSSQAPISRQFSTPNSNVLYQGSGPLVFSGLYLNNSSHWHLNKNKYYYILVKLIYFLQILKYFTHASNSNWVSVYLEKLLTRNFTLLSLSYIFLTVFLFIKFKMLYTSLTN